MREDFPPPDESLRPTPPERVGRHALLTEITRNAEPRKAGTPSQASLWVGRTDEGSEVGRLVLLRRMRRDAVSVGSLVTLRRAGVASARVRDPKIVAVLEVVVAETELALVSEYIEGEPLRSVQRLAAQRGALFPVPVSMRIALDVLMGVRAATKSLAGAPTMPGELPRALHGALAPDCILVASFGDAMLTDLAIGGVGNAIAPRARPPGMLAYAAPECFEASPSLDERTDVFSVGVLLWELVSGKTLFGAPATARAPEIDALVQRICNAPVPRLDAIRRAGSPVPGNVADIVARALERDPRARFQTVEEMIRAIRRLESGIATSDEVVTALDRFARPILDARRAALGQLADRANARDSMPESARPTHHPPAPVPATAIVPRIPAPPIPRPGAPRRGRPSAPSALSTLGFPATARPRPPTAVAVAAPPPPPAPEPEPAPAPQAPPLHPAPAALALQPADEVVEVEPEPTSREEEPKGPLAWAPDDAGRVASAPPDRLPTGFITDRTRRVVLHRVLPAVVLGSAILTLAIALSSPRRATSSQSEQAPTSASPSVAPAQLDPAPSVEPAPSSPPSSSPGAEAPAHVEQPAPPKKERASPPAGTSRPQRPGGERPRPASDGNFRPHGI